MGMMNYRVLGRTGWKISEIGFGSWAIGSAWGDVSEEDAVRALHAAIDQGVNFIDTADVYGDGRSERLVGQVVRERSERIYVATKAGRRLNPHVAEGFTRENLTAFVERSLKNLNMETIDLLQLHCPPTQVFYMPEVFGILDDLVQAGKLRYYGVSVEKVEEAIKAMEFPGVQSVQIIYNIFRQRPAELFFPLAIQHKVGILARVPLSSGMLSGKMKRETVFAVDDHRHFNRHGESFDVGETFSGVDYMTGLDAVDALRPFVPEGYTLAQLALRWILMAEAVTTTIPGAKNPRQAIENSAAAGMPALSAETMQQIETIYRQFIREQVHQRW